MFVERTRALEIGAASADAPHKRDPRRQVSDEANLSRMQRVRWWLGLGANRLFCQKLTVITELPIVVLDDNFGLIMHLDLALASDDTTFLDCVATLADIINCHAEMAIRQSDAGKARQLRFEGRCAPPPSFLTGTRHVGRAPSKALSPRPGRLAQELWERKRVRGERGREEGGEGEQGEQGGGREQACRWTASTLVRGQQLALVARAARARTACRSLALGHTP